MDSFLWPDWLQDWVFFAGWDDLAFAICGLVLATLLVVWWRQQTENWFRVVLATLWAGLTLAVASTYLFRVPPYFVGCPSGCTGWFGYPLPVGQIDLAGNSRLLPLDFALNLLLLWLLWLAASVAWRMLAVALRWRERSWRFKLLFPLVLAVLPWALLPRYFEPPQPVPEGEEMRLATNARRVAENTYGITGLWVQRLGLVDIRILPPPEPAGDSDALEDPNVARSEVCLQGYTYFYLPWRRYRITLDRLGVTGLDLIEQPWTDSCWE